MELKNDDFLLGLDNKKNWTPVWCLVLWLSSSVWHCVGLVWHRHAFLVRIWTSVWCLVRLLSRSVWDILTLHIFCSIKCLSISLLFLTNRNHLPMFLSYFPNFTFFTLQFIFLFRYGWFGSHHRRDITMPHNLSHTLAAHNTYCCVSVL